MDDERIFSILSNKKSEACTSLLVPGDEVKGWRVTAFVGKGATSEVYRGVKGEGSEQQVCAIKLLVQAEDERVRARFLRESEILSLISHKSLVRYIDSGDYEGHPFIITEYLEPFVLPHSDSAVARFLIRLSEGVAYLHARGFVHRDIKHANIMSRQGYPVLIDLGLIKDTTGPAVSFAPLTVVDGKPASAGSPEYGAPEQFNGDEINEQADIHALGILADKAFDGRPSRVWRSIILNATSTIKARRYPGIGSFIKAIKQRHLKLYLFAAIVPIIAICFLIAKALIIEVGTPSDLSSSEREQFIKEGILVIDRNTVRQHNLLFSAFFSARNLPYPDKDMMLRIGLTYSQSLSAADIETPQLTEKHHGHNNNPDDYVEAPANVIAKPRWDNFPDLFQTRRDTAIGEVLRFNKPIILKSGDRIRINVNDDIMADISGPSDAWVMVEGSGVLINTTTNTYPENAVRYFLKDGASVNFINLDTVDQINKASSYADLHCRYGANSQGLIYCGGSNPTKVVDWYSTEHKTEAAKKHVLDMSIYRSEAQLEKVSPESIINIELDDLTHFLKSDPNAQENLQKLIHAPMAQEREE